MQFALSDDEILVQQSACEVAEGMFSESAARAALSDPSARRAAWSALVELGWTGILVPVEAGGSGGTLLEACLIAEALYEHFPFVPFVGSAIAAATHLRFGSPRSRATEGVAAGEPYSVVLGRQLGWPGAPAVAAFDWMIGATGVYVAANGGVETAELRVRAVDDIDLLHPVAEVDAVATGALTTAEPLERAVGFSRMGVAAALTGIAGSAHRQAVAYAKERRQYGRTIGEFQAVQHLCAEMLVDVEASRSITYGGAWVVENAGVEEASRVARAAKAWCAAAALRVCEKSIQVLGGIGLTWEHPAHLRLRSAHVLARAFGAPGALAASLIVDATPVAQEVG